MEGLVPSQVVRAWDSIEQKSALTQGCRGSHTRHSAYPLIMDCREADPLHGRSFLRFCCDDWQGFSLAMDQRVHPSKHTTISRGGRETSRLRRFGVRSGCLVLARNCRASHSRKAETRESSKPNPCTYVACWSLAWFSLNHCGVVPRSSRSTNHYDGGTTITATTTSAAPSGVRAACAVRLVSSRVLCHDSWSGHRGCRLSKINSCALADLFGRRCSCNVGNIACSAVDRR